jgi:hypothetical protein
MASIYFLALAQSAKPIPSLTSYSLDKTAITSSVAPSAKPVTIGMTMKSFGLMLGDWIFQNNPE